MKKEARSIYKNDKDHKKRDHAHEENEKEIWGYFNNIPGILGIDSTTLNVNVTAIDDAVLKNALGGVNMVTSKYSDVCSEEYNVYEHYKYIHIKIGIFGELTICNEVTKNM